MKTTISDSTSVLKTLADADECTNISELNKQLDYIKTLLLQEEHVPNDVLVEIEVFRYKLNKL